MAPLILHQKSRIQPALARDLKVALATSMSTDGRKLEYINCTVIVNICGEVEFASRPPLLEMWPTVLSYKSLSSASMDTYGYTNNLKIFPMMKAISEIRQFPGTRIGFHYR